MYIDEGAWQSHSGLPAAASTSSCLQLHATYLSGPSRMISVKECGSTPRVLQHQSTQSHFGSERNVLYSARDDRPILNVKGCSAHIYTAVGIQGNQCSGSFPCELVAGHKCYTQVSFML